NPEVWDYGPRVILPNGPKLVSIRIIGPKISSANSTLNSGNNSAAEIAKTGDNELVADVRRSDFSFSDDGSNFPKYKLSLMVDHSSWWNPFSWNDAQSIERELVFWALPNTVAHYVISPAVVKSLAPESYTFVAHFSPHGKDNSMAVPVSVPPDLAKQGWVIDTDALLKLKWANPAQSGGSSCVGVDRNSITPTSFTYNVQFGHETDSLGHKSDGSVECKADVPLTRTQKQTVDGDKIEGNINWTDDVVEKLPPDTQKYDIKLRMFDGHTYAITDDSNVPFGL